MRLTIAIPTYNRPIEASKRLEEIISELDLVGAQLKEQVNVIVLENSCTQSYKASLSPFVGSQVHHITTSMNNGFCWNLLRCVEHATGEWLWILGDDDKIMKGAIDDILKAINNCSSSAIIYNNFCPKATPDSEVQDLKSLFEKSTLSEILFISGTIWNAAMLRRYFLVLVDFSYTMSPQLCVLLRILEDKSGSLFLIQRANVEFRESSLRSWSTLDYMERTRAVPRCLKEKRNQKLATQAQLVNFLWATGNAFENCRNSKDFKIWRKSFWYSLFSFSEFANVSSIVLSVFRISFFYLMKKYVFRRPGIRPSWEVSACLPLF